MTQKRSDHRLPKRNVYLTTLLCSSMIATTAQAEQDSDEQKDDAQLNAVVVQGQKIDRTLQETVTGISVLKGDDLTSEGAQDLAAALDEVSNVSLVSYGNRNEFTIRGIQSGGVSGTGKGTLSSVLVDGLPLVQSQINNNIPLWDVDQVVVAKGPMSTSVGQSSAAGTIFITSKEPEFNQSAAVRAGVGSNNLSMFSAMGNTVLTDDLALRVTADKQQTDGEITNEYRNDDRHDFRDNGAYKASLLYQPNYKFSTRFTVGYDQSKRGSSLACSGVQSTPGATCDRGDFKASQDVKPRYEDNRLYSILDVTGMLSDHWTVNSLTSWAESENKYDTDLDRNNPDSPTVATFAGSPIDSRYIPLQQDSVYRHLSEEIKFTYEHGAITSATGIYIANEETEADGNNSSIIDLNSLNPAAPAGMFYIPFTQTADGALDTTKAFAVFNETDIDLSETLTLTLGLRYNKEDRKYKSGALIKREMDLTTGDGLLGLPDGSLNAMLDGLATELSDKANERKEKTFTEWLPKFGISWDASDTMTLGYTFSKGYRSGGSDLNIGRGEVYDYDEETISNHELGLRSVWLNNQLVVNANLFYLDWKNQQVSETLSAAPFDTQISNAGESVVKGAELDVFFKADSGLNASLNAGYNDTEFKEFESNGRDYSGNKFSYNPDLTVAASVGFDQGEGFNIKWRTNYNGEAFTDLENEQKAKGYFLSHISAGYSQAAWQVDAYVNNVFDHNQVLNDYDWQLPIANVVTLVPGRTFGLIGQYYF